MSGTIDLTRRVYLLACCNSRIPIYVVPLSPKAAATVTGKSITRKGRKFIVR